MKKQFTASEVRRTATAIEGEQMLVSSMLRAFADMLEAQEKAVPVAITCDGYDGDRTGCIKSDKLLPLGTNLYTHPAPSDAERLAEALRNARGFVLHFGDEPARVCIAEIDAALAAHSAQAQPPAASVPDIDTMVSRFLGWKLPQDFAPDAGISFKPMPDIYMPHCWPTGTNLFHAGQAKEMILHMLAAQENPNG